MKLKTAVIIALAALVVAAGAFYWHYTHLTLDRVGALEKRISPILATFGLTDENLIIKSIEGKSLDGRRYTHGYREYEAPKTFSWKPFEKALRGSLVKTEFTIAKSRYTTKKDIEVGSVVINLNKFDVLTLKINKKRAVVPATVKKFANPKIAIVMDDFGYNLNDLDTLFGIKEPVTLSILPEEKYSAKVAKMAAAHGQEAILHLPLESHRSDVKEEVDTIRTGMSDKDVIARLKKDIEDVPGIKGVSNHMGSKSTEEKPLMTAIMTYLKKNNLYFFDSLTTEKSVCREVARSAGVRYARRDAFLDNMNNAEYIEKQLMDIEKLAFKKGKVIAICHDRKTTIRVLSKIMPEMVRDGVRFVKLSELVE